jgi:hypothetical protein
MVVIPTADQLRSHLLAEMGLILSYGNTGAITKLPLTNRLLGTLLLQAPESPPVVLKQITVQHNNTYNQLRLATSSTVNCLRAASNGTAVQWCLPGDSPPYG